MNMTLKNTAPIFIVAFFAMVLVFGIVSHTNAWTGASGGSDGSVGTCCSNPSTPTYNPFADNGGNNNTPRPAPTCSISANDTSITRGQAVTISWSSSRATSRTITHIGSGLAASGSVTLYPTQTTTYTGTFVGNGRTVHCSKTVTVTQPTPAPTCSISASPASITAGQSITVSWSSSHTVSGNISNVGNNIALSGSYVLYPQQNTTYTGTFVGQNGQTVTCTTSVVVITSTPQCPAGYTGTYPNCYPPVQQCPAGYSGVYPNCYPPVQYCPAGYTGTYPNCYPPQNNNLSCTISINNYGNGYNNGYWQPNSAVTLSWNSNSASYGSINGFGNVGPTGTRTVYPTQTTTYTGTFYNYQGQSVTCSATVYVQNYVPPVYPNTPYVTLSAVPYTGLDLGPVGTVVYWGFISLWCLLAAYLIAVKRVQNQVYASLMGLLFGTSVATPATAAHGNHSANVSYVAPAAHEDKTDDFIIEQLNRVRA